MFEIEASLSHHSHGYRADKPEACTRKIWNMDIMINMSQNGITLIKSKFVNKYALMQCQLSVAAVA